jgi:hypothetical protein
MKIRQNQSVPVVVETPSRPYFAMVRCNYLYIECDDPTPGWQIDFGRGAMPFLMLGLVGVIQTPLDALRFTEERHLHELFEWADSQPVLEIHFADLWLPVSLFAPNYMNVGAVYRLDYELFAAAFRFRDGRLPAGEFSELAEKFHGSSRFSEDETRTFDSWSRRTVEEVMNQKDKDPELRLGTRRTDDRR